MSSCAKVSRGTGGRPRRRRFARRNGTRPSQASPSWVSTGRSGGSRRAISSSPTRQWAKRTSLRVCACDHGESGDGHGRWAVVCSASACRAAASRNVTADCRQCAPRGSRTGAGLLEEDALDERARAPRAHARVPARAARRARPGARRGRRDVAPARPPAVARALASRPDRGRPRDPGARAHQGEGAVGRLVAAARPARRSRHDRQRGLGGAHAVAAARPARVRAGAARRGSGRTCARPRSSSSTRGPWTGCELWPAMRRYAITAFCVSMLGTKLDDGATAELDRAALRCARLVLTRLVCGAARAHACPPAAARARPAGECREPALAGRADRRGGARETTACRPRFATTTSTPRSRLRTRSRSCSPPSTRARASSAGSAACSPPTPGSASGSPPSGTRRTTGRAPSAARRRAVQEALRLYPASWFVARSVAAPATVAGIELAPETTVVHEPVRRPARPPLVRRARPLRPGPVGRAGPAAEVRLLPLRRRRPPVPGRAAGADRGRAARGRARGSAQPRSARRAAAAAGRREPPLPRSGPPRRAATLTPGSVGRARRRRQRGGGGADGVVDRASQRHLLHPQHRDHPDGERDERRGEERRLDRRGERAAERRAAGGGSARPRRRRRRPTAGRG